MTKMDLQEALLCAEERVVMLEARTSALEERLAATWSLVGSVLEAIAKGRELPALTSTKTENVEQLVLFNAVSQYERSHS